MIERSGWFVAALATVFGVVAPVSWFLASILALLFVATTIWTVLHSLEVRDLDRAGGIHRS